MAAGTAAACGSSAPRRTDHAAAATRTTNHAAAATTATTSTTTTKPKPPPAPAYPRLLAAATATGPTPFIPAVSWRGNTATWIARTPGVTLLSFDQRLVELHLHSGTIDAGTQGWRYGASIGGTELRHLASAFNGGFRLSTGAGGFESYGHVGYALRAGLGSIVTYADGTTDIGSWHQEVPAPGRKVASVRQNLPLLIDHGVPASNLDCPTCWGATLGGVDDPARSGLGITADGRLIWVGGEHLTVTQLAAALEAARVKRAVELDINPEWVAAYLYNHHGTGGAPSPVPALADQHGIPGEFLSAWSRDFFAVAVR